MLTAFEIGYRVVLNKQAGAVSELAKRVGGGILRGGAVGGAGGAAVGALGTPAEGESRLGNALSTGVKGAIGGAAVGGIGSGITGISANMAKSKALAEASKQRVKGMGPPKPLVGPPKPVAGIKGVIPEGGMYKKPGTSGVKATAPQAAGQNVQVTKATPMSADELLDTGHNFMPGMVDAAMEARLTALK